MNEVAANIPPTSGDPAASDRPVRVDGDGCAASGRAG
jgi:hypothetical protein